MVTLVTRPKVVSQGLIGGSKVEDGRVRKRGRLGVTPGPWKVAAAGNSRAAAPEMPAALVTAFATARQSTVRAAEATKIPAATVAAVTAVQQARTSPGWNWSTRRARSPGSTTAGCRWSRSRRRPRRTPSPVGHAHWGSGPGCEPGRARRSERLARWAYDTGWRRPRRPTRQRRAARRAGPGDGPRGRRRGRPPRRTAWPRESPGCAARCAAARRVADPGNTLAVAQLELLAALAEHPGCPRRPARPAAEHARQHGHDDRQRAQRARDARPGHRRRRPARRQADRDRGRPAGGAFLAGHQRRRAAPGAVDAARQAAARPGRRGPRARRPGPRDRPASRSPAAAQDQGAD